ncbi:MAG: hypothetical protein RQ745_06610 [Longimicrobiales bacterium]|nr:hypothetical protein [Longimicrobiales bacterium]
MERSATQARAGFALAVVVFLLFAVAMASATGYTVVSIESAMAIQGEESAEAAQIARAGLERYFGEHLGIPDDTTTYAIGGGTVYITARRMAPVDTADGVWAYRVRARAEVSNLSSAVRPATATVQQIAWLHEEPVARTAAFTGSYSSISLQGWTTIEGDDNSFGQCADSGGEDIHGVGHRGSLVTAPHPDNPSGPTPDIEGGPDDEFDFGTHAAVVDSAAVRWDVLQDPSFPVDYHNTVPDFSSLPTDEFPIVRVSGNLTATSSWSGRGVLIIPGSLILGSCCLNWEGLILAGNIRSTSGFWGYFFLRGMIIAGLDGTQDVLSINTSVGPQVYYDVCSALAASNALAWWEPLPDTFEEIQ